MEEINCKKKCNCKNPIYMIGLTIKRCQRCGGIVLKKMK